MLALGLLAIAGLAIWAGRGGRFAANRWITAGSVALGAGLLIVSFALSGPGAVGRSRRAARHRRLGRVRISC